MESSKFMLVVQIAEANPPRRTFGFPINHQVALLQVRQFAGCRAFYPSFLALCSRWVVSLFGCADIQFLRRKT